MDWARVKTKQKTFKFWDMVHLIVIPGTKHAKGLTIYDDYDIMKAKVFLKIPHQPLTDIIT